MEIKNIRIHTYIVCIRDLHEYIRLNSTILKLISTLLLLTLAYFMLHTFGKGLETTTSLNYFFNNCYANYPLYTSK